MSNIYLNEFDRLMKHQLKPLAYLRYGDDWLCFAETKSQLECIRQAAVVFLEEELSLTINPKIDRVQPAYKGTSYLGVDIWPNGRRLQPRVRNRVKERVNTQNVASYQALVAAHEKRKRLKAFNWQLLE
jgi:hypothetical protein